MENIAIHTKYIHRVIPSATIPICLYWYHKSVQQQLTHYLNYQVIVWELIQEEFMDQNIKKNHHPSAFKKKAALEAIKKAETTVQLASRFAIHPIQVGGRKKAALSAVHQFFLTPNMIATKFIDSSYSQLSLTEQTRLLGISRGSLYYQPTPVDLKTLDLMQKIVAIDLSPGMLKAAGDLY